MVHPLQHIPNITEILFQQGIENIIISPGSRNAPLTNAFFKKFGNTCTSVVDERSAAYVALGQALKTQKPSVIISTSGTAALNYAPAISEAFYQGVPLIVLTADRPPEWIAQEDNQAIRQTNLFEPNVKGSFTLPVLMTCEDDLWYAERIINEAFLLSMSGKKGPVHINVPLREPLYEEQPVASEKIKIIISEPIEKILPTNSSLLEQWKSAKSILLVCGQTLPDKGLNSVISNLTADSRVCIVGEPISNQQNLATVFSPELIFTSEVMEQKEFAPEMVIYLGGQIVSKRIKEFLRKLDTSSFYYIGEATPVADTFQNLGTIVNADPAQILKQLLAIKSDKNYSGLWKNIVQKTSRKISKFLQTAPWSDLKVFEFISNQLPNDAVVFAGNSSVVRYLFYFNQYQRTFYSNRGTSGIDGILSSAVGLASQTPKTVYAIVGDLSFVYDSNALWNRNFPKNLKIIVINNQGGGIFHLLNGPSEQPSFEPFFNAFHPVNIENLAQAFNIEFASCDSFESLKVELDTFLETQNQPRILEIKTPVGGNPEITREFLAKINS